MSLAGLKAVACSCLAVLYMAAAVWVAWELGGWLGVLIALVVCAIGAGFIAAILAVGGE